MAAQKIAFRTDASLQMGSGHVMRCLTLADALKAQGAECHFISRQHLGHLLAVIAARGYQVNCLADQVQKAQAATDNIAIEAPRLLQEPAHAAWLGTTWQNDAQATAAILADLQPDWLVVDHYALDQRWETALRPHYQKLMVIDDLADRPHQCDLLLDQNLGRQAKDYANLVPAQCKLLIGPQYALLRPEFSALRAYSLQRRQQPALQNILITMGGVDQPNATGLVLQALKDCTLPPDCCISVVMGLQAPWLRQVQAQAKDMPWLTEVLVNISDMAQRMADSDLAIGAAGSTSWERCHMGLPSLLVVLADNQQSACQALQQHQAALSIGHPADIPQRVPDLMTRLNQQPQILKNLSDHAAKLCNNAGYQQIIDQLLSSPNE